jgi:hypothetical protein
MKLREYRDGDYEAIQDCVEPGVIEGDFSDIKDRGVYLTVTIDDRPVACGGITLISDDEGEIWLKLSKEAMSRSIIMLRIFRAGLKIIRDSFGDIEIKARVLDGFEKGMKMAEHFGFNEDSIEKIADRVYRIYKWQTQ